MRPGELSQEAQINFLNTALHAKGHSGLSIKPSLSIKPIRPNVEDCYMYLDTLEEHS